MFKENFNIRNIGNRFLNFIWNNSQKPLDPGREIGNTSSLYQFDCFPNFSCELINYNGKSKVERDKGLLKMDEMLNNPIIREGYEIKRAAMLSQKLSVNTPLHLKEDKKAIEIRDFIEYNLRSVSGINGLGFKEVLSAFFFGRSITEICYKIEKSGRWKGKWILDRLKDKWIGQIHIEFDEFKNIKNLYINSSNGLINVPQEKFIIYLYNSSDSYPEGRPDAQTIYNAHLGIELAVKELFSFINKNSSPIVKLLFGPSATSADKTDAIKVAQDCKGNNVVAFMAGKIKEFELLFADPKAIDTFMKVLEYYDSRITKGILGPILATQAKTGSGATYSQAQVHQSLLNMLFKPLKFDFEIKILKQQLIKQLVVLNFADAEHLLPDIVLDDVDIKEWLAYVEGYCSLTDAGIVHPMEDATREDLGLPERDEKKYPLREAQDTPGLPTNVRTKAINQAKRRFN